MLDSKLYRFLETLTNFFFLNVVWLLACVPVVTIFPATAALFGVVREWVRQEDAGVLGPFVRRFKENFVQSLVVGWLWAILGALLLFNLLAIRRMPGPLGLPSLVLVAVVGLVYLTTTIYLFPVMVCYETTWHGVIRNAFFISASQPIVTIIGLVLTGAMVMLFYFAPITIVLSGSITAYLLYALCNRAFQRVTPQSAGEHQK
jgi:uncharacterized membrane protein YesL